MENGRQSVEISSKVGYACLRRRAPPVKVYFDETSRSPII
jgi:hypothetical protein